MKILITGGNGYIAKSLYSALKDDYQVSTISRDICDLTDSFKVAKYFSIREFDVVIHCAVEGGSRLHPDSSTVLDNNLKMYYNLLANKHKFKRLIHLGSGAEDYAKDTPYGLSKYVIKKSIEQQDNFYSIQIFGLFDENELDNRFIKSNIKRYISKEPMSIDVHKKMSFFYMKDLVKVIRYGIDNPHIRLLKQVHCSYVEDYTLREIADMINELGDYRVPIHMTEKFGEDYIPPSRIQYSIGFLGLRQGITNVYNKLTNAAN
jgi:GDP-L-fucose synthase